MNLKEIFKERLIEVQDGSLILTGGIVLSIQGTLGSYLVVNKIKKPDDFQCVDIDYYLISIKDVLRKDYRHMRYATKLDSTFISKFGYSFDFEKFDLFCKVSFEQSSYILPAGVKLTIEDFIMYLPDLVFNKGLRMDYLELSCTDVNWEKREAGFCIFNTQNKQCVSRVFTFTELNSLRFIDLVSSHKELYPVSRSKYITIIEVSRDGYVRYHVLYKGKSCIESLPLDLFLTSTVQTLLGRGSCNSSLSDNFCDAFTKDIKDSIKEYKDNVTSDWGY